MNNLHPFLMSFNDWLGPLMALGTLSLAFLVWIGLEIAKRRMRESEQEPAPVISESQPESRR